MNNDTTNSLEKTCSHRSFIRHGERRRKCRTCGVTWTTHPMKRGPKREKQRIDSLKKTFVEHLTLVQQAKRSMKSSGAFSKAHGKLLTLLAKLPWPHKPPEGQLILVLDALWQDVKDKRWTLYLLGLRSVGSEDLIFFPPLLRPGNESKEQWKEAIDGIPEEVRKRICAIVSDSYSGSGDIAKMYGWIFQRCQAHLILKLSKLCGDNKRTVSWRTGRREIRMSILRLLNTHTPETLERTKMTLKTLSENPSCPKVLVHLVHHALEHANEYRSCFSHRELRLPATTNSVENTNGRIRTLLERGHGLRTSKSLQLWIHGYMYFHPTVKCRPKHPQN